MDLTQVLGWVATFAITLLAGVVAWAVLHTVKQASKISAIQVSLVDLTRRADLCDADRHLATTSMAEVKESLATLIERSSTQTKTLERIESAAASAVNTAAQAAIAAASAAAAAAAIANSPARRTRPVAG